MADGHPRHPGPVIDPNAVGVSTGPTTRSWTSDDALLYALGVGAGDRELAFTTENSHDCPQRVLPTFAVIIAPTGATLRLIGEIEAGRVVHGAQSVTLHRSPAASGTVEVIEQVSAIHDKGPGKHAIVEMTASARDAVTGELVLESTASAVLRGLGGFGGDPGASSARGDRPSGAPDLVVEDATLAQQGLLYRLTGDRNPLHSDPWFAKERGGFDAPILHGLCTFGFAGRAILHGLCDGDPDRFGTMAARFSAPVYPGEQLRTTIWRGTDGAAFRTVVAGDNRVVLDGGEFRYRPGTDDQEGDHRGQ
jgi:acyl dehydratase